MRENAGRRMAEAEGVKESVNPSIVMGDMIFEVFLVEKMGLSSKADSI